MMSYEWLLSCRLAFDCTPQQPKSPAPPTRKGVASSPRRSSGAAAPTPTTRTCTPLLPPLLLPLQPGCPPTLLHRPPRLLAPLPPKPLHLPLHLPLQTSSLPPTEVHSTAHRHQPICSQTRNVAMPHLHGCLDLQRSPVGTTLPCVPTPSCPCGTISRFCLCCPPTSRIPDS